MNHSNIIWNVHFAFGDNETLYQSHVQEYEYEDPVP